MWNNSISCPQRCSLFLTSLRWNSWQLPMFMISNKYLIPCVCWELGRSKKLLCLSLFTALKLTLSSLLFWKLYEDCKAEQCWSKIKMILQSQLDLILSSYLFCKTSCSLIRLTFIGMVMWKVVFSDGTVSPCQAVLHLGHEEAVTPLSCECSPPPSICGSWIMIKSHNIRIL